MRTPNPNCPAATTFLAALLSLVLQGLVSPVQARDVFAQHDDHFTWKGFPVLNNQWGRQNALNAGWYQRVVREDDGTISIEYKWDSRDYNIMGYPAVVVGWHYGSLFGYRTPMSAFNLPSRVSDNPSYRVSADVSHTNDGTYLEYMNVAWDVWFGTNDNPKVPSHEMMVWPWYVRQLPDGTLQGRISVWNAQWEVYRGQVSPEGAAWKTFAFLRTTPTLQPTGDLGEFIRYLRSRDWLPGDARVIGIQFGTELGRGQGSFRIRNYSLETSPATTLRPVGTNATAAGRTNAPRSKAPVR